MRVLQFLCEATSFVGSELLSLEAFKQTLDSHLKEAEVGGGGPALGAGRKREKVGPETLKVSPDFKDLGLFRSRC